MLHSLEEVSQDGSWESVMAVQEKCDEKSGMGQPGCADISAPTLYKVREEWGTPQCICANEIKDVATCVGATSQKREAPHPQLFLSVL